MTGTEPVPQRFAQQIPRPAAVEPGAPPPWAHRPGPGRPRVSVDDLRRAVAGLDDLPPVTTEVAPASAVLVAVWEEDGEARILLTRRTAWLRSHSAQVAFPGGRVEPGETLVAAALREAEEEVGLDPAAVEVIGRLSRLHTISSGADIHPVVGVLPARPALMGNPAEVDRVFDVAVGELMADRVFHEEIWGVAGVARSIYFFEVAGETVWGVTARMLYELLCLVIGRTAPPAAASGPEPGGASPPAPA